ncbi:hypothetical protein GCM10009434_18510 [Brevundimonas olei]
MIRLSTGGVWADADAAVARKTAPISARENWIMAVFPCPSVRACAKAALASSGSSPVDDAPAEGEAEAWLR